MLTVKCKGLTPKCGEDDGAKKNQCMLNLREILMESRYLKIVLKVSTHRLVFSFKEKKKLTMQKKNQTFDVIKIYITSEEQVGILAH